MKRTKDQKVYMDVRLNAWKRDAIEEVQIKPLLDIAKEMEKKGILKPQSRTHTLYLDLKWRFEKIMTLSHTNFYGKPHSFKPLVKNLAIPLKRELMKLAREHNVRLNSWKRDVYILKKNPDLGENVTIKKSKGFYLWEVNIRKPFQDRKQRMGISKYKMESIFEAKKWYKEFTGKHLDID